MLGLPAPYRDPRQEPYTRSLVALTPKTNNFGPKYILAVVAVRLLAVLEQNPLEVNLFFIRPKEIKINLSVL